MFIKGLFVFAFGAVSVRADGCKTCTDDPTMYMSDHHIDCLGSWQVNNGNKCPSFASGGFCQQSCFCEAGVKFYDEECCCPPPTLAPVPKPTPAHPTTPCDASAFAGVFTYISTGVSATSASGGSIYTAIFSCPPGGVNDSDGAINPPGSCQYAEQSPEGGDTAYAGVIQPDYFQNDADGNCCIFGPAGTEETVVLASINADPADKLYMQACAVDKNLLRMFFSDNGGMSFYNSDRPRWATRNA